jgi:hypothetical protein
MEVKAKKWEPGKEPLYPFQDGMTRKPGLTIRAEFAKVFLAGIVSNPRIELSKDGADDAAIELSLHLADVLIDKLYPAPVTVKIAPVDEEKHACAHDGEIIMQNGSFQCMKCKNAVPYNVIQARAKK